MAQNTFERIEEKYLLSPAQLGAVHDGLTGHMHPDPFGRSTVSSIYYDTEDYRLIRTSLEKPDYKEKLRLRWYGTPSADSTVFVELKKKFDGVVYKRRAQLTAAEAEAFLTDGKLEGDAQVLREIRYFMSLYRPVPRVLLSYRRIAYTGAEQGLRITFDDSVRFRAGMLRLNASSWGREILPPGQTLMEVKASGAMPLWLCRVLGKNEIYPASFSKYGTSYRDYIYPEATRIEKGESSYA
ncbi:MAG TPA: polyphosphate polymerase domain-containing protein [Eubacteriales bacterium]|nr:polyphosphate polymerase domain-containing protein [Eubacteriales bacterium]